MKYFYLFVLFFQTAVLFSQNLHTHSNAASGDNESNSVLGWNSNANLTSSGINPQSGNFSLRVAATGQNSRDMNYTFNAVVGEQYIVSIWARGGESSFQPAFANWTGVQGFNTTLISGTNWTEYTWTLIATNSNPLIRVYAAPYSGWQVGHEVFIDNVSITILDAEAPSVPTGLLASNLGTTGLDLSWTASTDNLGVSDYEVFQNGVSLGLTGGLTSYTVSGLTPSTTYSFTVRALDGSGNMSLQSVALEATTLSPADTEAPSIPTGLLVSNLGTTGLDLSWTASTDNVGVSDYEVFQNGVSLGLTGGLTSYTVSGLTPSTTYSFTVRALDGSGNMSLQSVALEATTLSPADTEAPSIPTGLLASNLGTTGLDLSWAASTDNVGVSDYEVFQNGVSLGLTGGLTSYTVSGLTPSTTYSFTVRALDGSGNMSLQSVALEATTLSPADTESPSIPTGLLVSNLGTTGLDLSWAASADNVGVSDYEVFQNGVSLGVTGGLTNYTVSGLTPSTTYSFTVRALDGSENMSLQSVALEVTTLSPADTEAPSVPTGLLASNLGTTGLDLSWTASTDNVGVSDYEVFQSGVSLGLTGGLTSYTVSGLTPSTTYSFTVRALDGSGNMSLQSDAFEATTLSPADTEAPSIPTGLLASNLGTTGLDLSWTASTDNVGVSDYEVFQNGVSLGLTGGLTSYTVSGLTPSTTYSFTVRALDGSGNMSLQSVALEATTLSPADTEAPSVPTGLLASNLGTTGLDLSWTASTDNVGVSDYEVFQNGVSLGLTGGLTSYTVSGLTPSSTYSFTVRALDGSGNMSLQSVALEATTLSPADTESPSVPTGLLASNLGTTGLDLSWTASTDNVGVSDYEVFQNGVSLGLTGGLTSYTVSGLTPSSTYSFTVRALDGSGNMSLQSVALEATTLNEEVNYTDQNANRLDVDWYSNHTFVNGNLGIGTLNTSNYRLAVAGGVVAEEINVALQTSWPDYVFEKGYDLPTLKDVELFIRKYGHLPNVPSANEVKANGIDLAKMNVVLLEKIEEMTLYILQMEKRVSELEQQIDVKTKGD
ncbi:fibronectin type III domain-containing protein [Formosa sp. A9]|uniref:fibronectin type III domain-containing protein n=1 Tax=Formosa sp. A9 TaxID=3442641 RepID=UPI003EB9B66F